MDCHRPCGECGNSSAESECLCSSSCQCTTSVLLFGLEYGKRTTKCWWIATMSCFALEAIIYEPVQIAILFVALPALVRTKMRKLYDPTENRLHFQPLTLFKTS